MIFSCFAASPVRCKKPQPPEHGRYKPYGRTLFKLNEVITPVCDSGYYLWGEVKETCCGLDNGDSAWLPTTSGCSDFIIADSKSWDKSGQATECLLPAKYDEECKKSGKHGVILNDEMSCKDESEGR